MKKVSGHEISSKPFVDDDAYTNEEFARCLCGNVPKELRIDLQIPYFSETQKRWRYKNVVTSHMECPLHGIAPEPRDAQRNESTDLQ